MDDETNFKHPNRTATHGQVVEVSVIAQKLKELLASGPSWQRMTPLHREMLETVATKLARIVCGDPTTRDHWRGAAWALVTASENVAATRATDRLFPRPMMNTAALATLAEPPASEESTG